MADYFVYMLECRGSRLYTGYSTDPRRRYRQHESGRARCRFTTAFPPLRPAACWRLKGSRKEAMRLERWIQGQTRRIKDELVRSPERLAQLFPDLDLSVEKTTDWRN